MHISTLVQEAFVLYNIATARFRLGGGSKIKKGDPVSNSTSFELFRRFLMRMVDDASYSSHTRKSRFNTQINERRLDQTQ